MRALLILIFMLVSMTAHAACPPATNCPSPTYNSLSANTISAVSGLSASGTVSGPGFVARFSSPGPIGNTTPNLGIFTTVSTALMALTGPATQNINVTWIGGWPGTGNANVGTNAVQAYQGTPGGCYHDSYNCGYPLNLYQVTDQLVETNSGASVWGMEINDIMGGGATAGSHAALYVNATIANSTSGVSPFYNAINSIMVINAGAGGTALAPVGAAFALGIVLRLNQFDPSNNQIYWNNFNIEEIDQQIVAGASWQTSSALAIVNQSAAGAHASVFEAGLAIGADGDTWNTAAISLAPFPVSTTGSLIISGVGTGVSGIDFSLSTFTGWLIKGQNNSGIDGANFVHTDEVQAVTTSSLALSAPGGNPMAVFDADSNSPTHYVVLRATSTAASIDSNSGALNIGTGGIGSVAIGKSGNAISLIGNVAFATSGGTLGFYAATPIVKATPVGACASNTGCQALRDALGNLGLINTGSITN